MAQSAAEALARAADWRATWYSLAGRYGIAAAFAWSALVLSTVRFGPGHRVEAVMRRKLARIYEEGGRLRRAERSYKGALATWEVLLGPEHPEVANALDDLAGLYRRQGQERTADFLAAVAAGIRERAMAPTSAVAGAGDTSGDVGRYGMAGPLREGRRTCPVCGGRLTYEKDTMSGGDMKSYFCSFCSWTKDEDHGPALWAVLTADRERTDGGQ